MTECSLAGEHPLPIYAEEKFIRQAPDAASTEMLSRMEHTAKQPRCVDRGKLAFKLALARYAVEEMEVEAFLTEGPPRKKIESPFDTILRNIFL